MSVYAKIRTQKEGPVLTARLAYPERRNAIGPQMVNELLHALAEAHADPEVHVIVLAGEGKAFCAGGDFAQMTSSSDAPQLERHSKPGDYADLLLAMVRAQKPIVAKVHGAAMGGGLGLVAASTLVVASTEAEFGTPEILVGLFPMMIMAVLARLVPRRRLMEMMLLGEKLSAEEAKSAGLVNQVVAPAALDGAVATLCQKLAAKSPSTMRLGLRAFAEQDDEPLETALPKLRERLAECLATDDAREGLMAFLEKRPPKFTGK
ncbi:enoyl-CoA hydratase-related protein [Pendulispora rubella]|uniref:Enoyl-CoA hydratase-related protein n=1 Tax=Pendulispora rubella TaxID=2741070 RepID=A0ABZ2LAZ7_9BACT